MTARLIVRTENEQARVHWIDQPVIRIGGAECCDVVVRSFPPHLLTVQQERDQFTVINRGTGSLRLSRRLLAPQQTVPWRVGDILTAGPVQLVLSTAQEGEPDFVKVDASGQIVDDASPASERSTRHWELVLIPVLIITAWLVFFDGSGDRIGTNVAFDRLVTELSSNQTDDPRIDKMRLLLQHARSLELRGATDAACAKYGAIRDLLAASPHARNRQEQQLLTFVKSRLVAHAH